MVQIRLDVTYQYGNLSNPLGQSTKSEMKRTKNQIEFELGGRKKLGKQEIAPSGVSEPTKLIELARANSDSQRRKMYHLLKDIFLGATGIIKDSGVERSNR